MLAKERELDQISAREDKLNRLKELGIEPYPYSYDPTHSTVDVRANFDALEGSTVKVAGRLVAIRLHGKSCFAHIKDREGKLQVYFKFDVLGERGYNVVKLLDLGDWIGVEGEVFKTRTGEITILVHELSLLSKCLRPLPEKWHGLKDVELRSRRRYLDLIVNEFALAVFRKRTAVVKALRRVLDERGFIEVETPILQPIYGGAFARPFVTHHNTLDIDLYLRISNELYLKRLIVGGLERVYEIGKDFRNEGMDRLHNPEFTQLEVYQAYADYNDMMDLCEELVRASAVSANGSARVEYEGMVLDFDKPWKRLSFYDGLERALGVDFSKIEDEEELKVKAKEVAKDMELEEGMTRGKILDELFSTYVQRDLKEPTFVVDYPVELSPLAKRHRSNPSLVERFEPVVMGVEIGNAYSELNDPADQRERFLYQQRLREMGDGEAQPIDEDFLMALEYGMPPTGGLGVGVDRLVMLLTGVTSIREVILFPQMRPEGGG